MALSRLQNTAIGPRVSFGRDVPIRLRKISQASSFSLEWMKNRVAYRRRSPLLASSRRGRWRGSVSSFLWRSCCLWYWATGWTNGWAVHRCFCCADCFWVVAAHFTRAIVGSWHRRATRALSLRRRNGHPMRDRRHDVVSRYGHLALVIGVYGGAGARGGFGLLVAATVCLVR